MRIDPFELERWQSVHEHHTGINLAESGAHPLRVGELAAGGDRDALLGQALEYTQTNGTGMLRERIAALYDGASAANVLVTNGSAEANLLACWHLIEPGDEAVVVHPVYMQIPGLIRSFGATVREVWLEPGPSRWRLDLDAVRRAVGPRTRFIAVCNPNNPTGARLDGAAVAELRRIAADRGCWLLADEVYRGAELDGRDTPSAWSGGERVLVTGGLSKAYGLPGLRIGWLAGPPGPIAALWAHRDYTSIAPGAVNDLLARLALEPGRRVRLLARTRRILAENQAIVAEWAADQPGRAPDPAGGGGRRPDTLYGRPALGRAGGAAAGGPRRARRAGRPLRPGLLSQDRHRGRAGAAAGRAREARPGALNHPLTPGNRDRIPLPRRRGRLSEDWTTP